MANLFMCSLPDWAGSRGESAEARKIKREIKQQQLQHKSPEENRKQIKVMKAGE